MIKELIALIEKEGLKATVMDPSVSNTLYKKVASAIQSLWAFNVLLGAGEDWPEDSYEVVAIENSFGVAKAITANGTANVVKKLGSKSQRIKGVDFLEVVNFQQSDIKAVLQAQAGTTAYLRAASRAFVNNALHLQTRLAVALEKMYWDGICAGVYTVEYKGGDSIGVLTDTNVMTAKSGTELWTATTTADPLADLRAMAQEFRFTGFAPDTITMTSATYNQMIACDKVSNSLTEVEKSLIAQGKTLENIGDYKLHIYDGSYVATQGGDPTTFIPDGTVVMAQFVNNQDAVRRINMMNLNATTDGNLATVMGEHFKTKVIADPARVQLLESYSGLLSFEKPKAFVAQKMYTPS